MRGVNLRGFIRFPTPLMNSLGVIWRLEACAAPLHPLNPLGGMLSSISSWQEMLQPLSCVTEFLFVASLLWVCVLWWRTVGSIPQRQHVLLSAAASTFAYTRL